MNLKDRMNTETAQTTSLTNTTPKLNQLSQEKELIKNQSEAINLLKTEIQTLSSEKSKLALTITELKTELLETQKINQSLTKSNNDLREENGLLTKKEQQELEDENTKLKSINTTLKKLVNNSSVEVVNKALKDRDIARNELSEYKKISKKEIRKINNQKHLIETEMIKVMDLLERKSRLHWRFLTFILICICVKSKPFLNDIKDSFIEIQKSLASIWTEYFEWLSHPSYLTLSDGFKPFTGYTIWIARVMVVILAIILVLFILRKFLNICIFYKRRWCTLSLKVFVISLTVLLIFGDKIKSLLPSNLLLIFLAIQLLYLGILKYMDGYYENRRRFDEWEHIQNM